MTNTQELITNKKQKKRKLREHKKDNNLFLVLKFFWSKKNTNIEDSKKARYFVNASSL